MPIYPHMARKVARLPKDTKFSAGRDDSLACSTKDGREVLVDRNTGKLAARLSSIFHVVVAESGA